jgi:CheY-like chemotaxis protein
MEPSMRIGDENLEDFLERISKEGSYYLEDYSPNTLLSIIFLELEKAFFSPDNREIDHSGKLKNFTKQLEKQQVAEQAKDLLLAFNYSFVAPFFQPTFAKLLKILELGQSIDLFRYGDGFSTESFKPQDWDIYLPQVRQKPLMLLVEQDPQLGQVILDAITLLFGHDILVLNATDSGTRGLIYALSFRPDFIFTDGWHLYSVINGYEMLRLLKQFPETKTIPFSIVTANTPSSVPRDMMHEAQAYLLKPFDLSDYEAAIQKHLDLLAKK